MPTTCHICQENYINNNTKCKTCKKSLCLECYDRISKFLNIKNERVDCQYKCPYCNSIDTKPLEDFSSDVLIRFTETAVLNYISQIEKIEELMEENSSLRDEYDGLIIQLRGVEIQDKKDRRDVLKYRQLKKNLQELKQKGRRTVKFEEIEKLI